MMGRWTWRRVFRLLALGLAVAGLAGWLVGGAHVGWTRTSAPVRTLDEVTGLEAIHYERRFVPGLDFVAALWAAAGLVAGLAFLFRKDARVAPSQPTDENRKEEP